MKTTQQNAHPLRIFWFAGLLTIIIGSLVSWFEGLAGLWIFIILLVLELTFSFDNAVVNSKVLATLSPFWQKIFLTVGIFIAVFVVRFVLPIVIVMIAAHLGFGDVVHLAMHDPARYGQVLHHAAPMIDAFGGAFLLMIGIHYFMDRRKTTHWLKGESWLARAGRFENLKICLMLSVAVALYFTVAPEYQTIVLISSILGILLHIGIELFGSFFHDDEHGVAHQAGVQVGWAAFASFLYLEVLDASFSFDGVIGAFAITTSLLLIIAGLGVGAIWVRALTVYLMRAGTLTQYRYLEHGAHWAIMALGAMMYVKLYQVEPPEWVTGSIGLVFIVTAICSSMYEKRRLARRQQAQQG